ncbi:MAG: bifunctional phosphoribosyl-AMP cyclohydrolase/phosphoribosyl-ATP diphosphatase [Flavobacteriaceae bacterium CG_4_8_14_3_um_filter_34_10]|nr:MAG: bifunctional phosphoribosyl-AMP cyclohydrolase/phosphoribosyl-ATP diphosphatase [Flavobacteriaceae bacterium CG18_big_fil_WC_8_21_14_2_50_34_36]PIV50158.1 MAG: bifunctional phosphoribosyl-AMP cyclohydrolase/phosphoribosyl-ATP diphosphatase [Flavobacteriaceae bacterium CG02_land_8_20_14_3_00_34_13]PIX08565.1 MAG: bifunctional phosphoribosyl-AMP cyclohydrolase/phosphoribosyl-ATP diphosphatase [Flavobacteriaceae bacterium CG_4_8_14_3_um_filter_34_10]PIZ08836.1 MAG: bifunctional phosphoribos
MNIDFTKNKNGLVPAIIQDYNTKQVLMLGYMNEDAFIRTQETQLVTFFSRSKKRLWTKGEQSGNFLKLVDIKVDCDRDTLLIHVNPTGPTCHKGTATCWGEDNTNNFGFLLDLEKIITNRKKSKSKGSYVATLFDSGINKIAQKVGEEAIEVVIEAKDDNELLFLNESADLLFHYLILLQAKEFVLEDVVKILEKRHTK